MKSEYSVSVHGQPNAQKILYLMAKFKAEKAGQNGVTTDGGFYTDTKNAEVRTENAISQNQRVGGNLPAIAGSGV